MLAFDDISISRKLTRMSMIVSVVVLLISCGSFVLYEILTFERTATDRLASEAVIIGINSTPALVFEDRVAAAETLASLRATPNVVAAAIYRADGSRFASYVRGFGADRANLPDKLDLQAEWPRIEDQHILVARRMQSDGKTVGAVYIQSDTSAVGARLQTYAAITLCILGVSVLVALLVSHWIEKRISGPILELVSTANAIAADKNYSLRTGVKSADEIGKLAGAFDGMLEQIEIQTEGIRQREQDLRELADAMPQMVWSVMADGSLGYVNRQLVEYTGMAANDVKTWSWGVGLHPEDLERCVEGWTTALRTGHPYHDECRMRRASDGAYRWHLARAVPVHDRSGRIVQWFATCTDIDAQKKAETDIRELNAELEKRVEERTAQLTAVNRELEAFTYSVSHDLRAPLRAVDGFSRILQEDYDDKLDDEGRRILKVIRESSQEMGRLIDDLLAFSHLGRREIQGQDTDMNKLAREVVEELCADAPPEHRTEIEVRSLPIVRCDRSLVRQVWVNLISNAIKFSAKAEHPRVEIGAYPSAEGYVCYVSDNGAGFDMKYYDKLFGVFQRLHSSQDFPGTGVGLAIVQRVVSKHGGRVWAEGEVNRGAKFFFMLPK